MSFEVFGVDLPSFGLRMAHGLMAAGWLLFDFLVFWLHFDVKNPGVPLERRYERARIMHGIDTVVAWIFLLMLPTGIALCYLTDTPLFTTGWLNLKHLLYAVIVVDALYLLPISGTAIRHLEAMREGADDVDRRNLEIRTSMDRAMPAVWLVWALVAVISLLSMLNLKAPADQDLIFRKTHLEAPGTSGGEELS